MFLSSLFQLSIVALFSQGIAHVPIYSRSRENGKSLFSLKKIVHAMCFGS